MRKQLLLFCALTFAIIQLYNRFTDGFSLSQIRSFHPVDSRFAPSSLPAEAAAAFAQSYRYLGKGCQFYAFESEDGDYVLKFLKQKHVRPSSPLFTKSQMRRRARLERLFSSVQLAFERMEEESGLLYIHLTPVPATGYTLTLIDKVGLKHRVALDEHEFVLQKRARTAEEVFAAASESEARARISQLKALVEERCAKGIRDRDRSFVQNIAFSEKRAHYIDVGQMVEDEAIKGEVEDDLKRRMGNLRSWLEQHYPHLSSLVERDAPPDLEF